MQETLASLSFILRRPVYLFLFWLFTFPSFASTAMKYMGALSGASFAILALFMFFVSTWFLAGVYGVIARGLEGGGADLAEYLGFCNRYFGAVLLTQIMLGVAGIILQTVSISLYVAAFHRGTDPATLSGEAGVILARKVPAFLLTAVFAYAIPAIVMRGATAFRALRDSARFLVNHFPRSVQIVLLAAVPNAVSGGFEWYAAAGEAAYRSSWRVSAFEYLIVTTAYLVLFLTGCRLLQK